MHRNRTKNYLEWTPLGSIYDPMDQKSTITGSSHLLDITIDGQLRRLLIDGGSYNGSPLICERNNELPIDPKTWEVIDPSTIWSILVTHTHADHIWRVPKFVWNGYKGDIHMSSHASSIAESILRDNLHVNLIETEAKNEIIESKRKQLGSRLNRALSKDNQTILNQYGITKNCDIAKVLAKEFSNGIKPIFTEEDLKITLDYIVGHDYHTNYKKNIFHLFSNTDLVRARLLDAGHIFGSAMSLIEIKRPGKNRIYNILWWWDLGRVSNRIYGDAPYLWYVKKPIDLMFVESTYGGRNHPDIKWEIAKLEKGISSTFKNWWQVLIPCFTQTRQQEMLMYLLNIIDREKSLSSKTKIVFDSPLGKKVLDEMMQVYPEYRDMIHGNPNIIWAEKDQTLNILLQKNPNYIFLTSGGMLQWGTSSKLIDYFNRRFDSKSSKKVLKVNDNSIAHRWLVVISGYMPEYTLGYKVLHDHDSYNSLELKLSSHADHQGIVDFITNKDDISGVELRDNAKICTMHGSIESMYKIKEWLENAGIDGKNIIVPSANGKTFGFDITW